MTHDERTMLFAAVLFAGGAVALIMYQHANATSQIIAAAGSPGMNPGVGAPVLAGGPIWNASLAGMPTPGSLDLQPVPAVSPVQINPGYTAGPNGSGGAFKTQPSAFMYQ